MAKDSDIGSQFRTLIQRIAQIQALGSAWQTLSYFATRPWLQAFVIGTVALLWSLLCSDLGPFAFVAAFVGFGAVLWIRNQMRFRTELDAIRQAVTAPPEIHVETKTVAPPGYQRLREIEEFNHDTVRQLITVVDIKSVDFRNLC